MLITVGVERADTFNGIDGKEQLYPPIPSGQTLAENAAVAVNTLESKTEK